MLLLVGAMSIVVSKFLELDGVEYYFLDNKYYFDRPDLYGYYDDGERFAFSNKP